MPTKNLAWLISPDIVSVAAELLPTYHGSTLASGEELSMRVITALWRALRVVVTSRADLALENLALQHQVLILQRSVNVHCNVTAHPTAQWTTQQIVEAFPFDDVPRFLLRDRDHITAHISASA